MTPEKTFAEKRAILIERAKVLAREPGTEMRGPAPLKIVAFRLAYETYGLESAFVREIYPLKDFTPLPCTPPFVLGIINVRGQILSVIDLKKFFDLPEKGLTDLNKVIIIENDQMEVGILADAILGIQLIPPQNIQTSLPTLTGVREKYLKGISEHTVILDAEKLLSNQDIIVRDNMEV